MKTITYDETKFQLLPIRLDGNMITAAANTELLANRNHGEPASISDIWDALRAAAPQPECVEQAAEPAFHGETHVAVPIGILAACRFSIEKKKDSPGLLAELRRYTIGDLSIPVAQPQPFGNRGELRTAALALADAMENKTDMPLHKWAVKCLFLVNRVRRAAGVTPAQEPSHDGE